MSGTRKLNHFINLSITGFNGSPHCNHGCIGSFMQSYVDRKKTIIDKLEYKLQGFPNAKSRYKWLKKLEWHNTVLRAILNLKNAKTVSQTIQLCLDNRRTKLLEQT